MLGTARCTMDHRSCVACCRVLLRLLSDGSVDCARDAIRNTLFSRCTLTFFFYSLRGIHLKNRSSSLRRYLRTSTSRASVGCFSMFFFFGDSCVGPPDTTVLASTTKTPLQLQLHLRPCRVFLPRSHAYRATLALRLLAMLAARNRKVQQITRT